MASTHAFLLKKCIYVIFYVYLQRSNCVFVLINTNLLFLVLDGMFLVLRSRSLVDYLTSFSGIDLSFDVLCSAKLTY